MTTAKTGEEILVQLEKNIEFRDFVITNSGCFNDTEGQSINTLIDEYLAQEYRYVLCIDDVHMDFPKTRIFTDVVFMTGNLTVFKQRTVRLYHWFE